MRSSSIRRAACVWALIFSELKAKVVDYVSGVLDDIGSLSQVSGGSIAAKILKCGEMVGECGGGKATEDALSGKQV